MTTVVIDEKSKMGKLIMNLIKETNCGKIIDDKKPNRETLESLKDSLNGKVTKTKSVKDLMQKLSE